MRLGVCVMIASDIREDAGRLEEISFEYLREVKLTGQPDDIRRKLWCLKETGCIGIPPFGGDSARKGESVELVSQHRDDGSHARA